MEAVLLEDFFIGNLKGIKLSLINRTKIILKQILHFQISKKELTWWENNIMTATKSLKKLPIDTTIYTDANLDGWGTVCEKSRTRGMWTKQEQALPINALELLGAKLELFSFFKDNKDIKNIRVMMDNNTAVAYINNLGAIRSDLCDDIDFGVWQWAAQQQIWVSAAHIPGSGNVVADKNSRIFEWSSEWKLRESVFKHCQHIW